MSPTPRWLPEAWELTLQQAGIPGIHRTAVKPGKSLERKSRRKLMAPMSSLGAILSRIVARLARLELTTPGFEAQYSIR